MKFVVDANVVFSALIAYNQKMIDLFFSKEIELFAPETLLKEIEEHKEEILKKTRYAEQDFEVILSLLYSRIELIPFPVFEKELFKAKELCPDEDDIEYFAVALFLDCPVWSNDKRLKQQERIKVISSHELLSILKSN